MKTTVKALIWLIGISVVGVLSAAPVWAHASMTKSSPANNATVAATPAVIQAWFSEELSASGNYLRLYDAHDKLLATGALDPKISSHMVLKLVPPRLNPGGYLVRWYVVAADDGAVTQGYFRFTVGATAMAPNGMGGSHAMAPGGTGASSLPPLQLAAPADHSAVKNPVAIVLETPGDMSKLTMSGMMSMGSNGPKVHLHIIVDGVTTMPSSDQLTALGNHRYKYILAPLPRGTHTVKVFWADNKTHDAAGPVRAATFTVTQ